MGSISAFFYGFYTAGDTPRRSEAVPVDEMDHTVVVSSCLVFSFSTE